MSHFTFTGPEPNPQDTLQPLSQIMPMTIHNTVLPSRKYQKIGLFTLMLTILTVLSTTGCTPKVEVSASDPITINLNVKIEHEIRVKVEKELEDVFSEDSGLF